MERASSSSTSTSGGIGFTGLLTIVFITLKLAGVISWSWWLVLSPLLICGCIGVAIVIFLIVFAAMVSDR